MASIAKRDDLVFDSARGVFMVKSKLAKRVKASLIALIAVSGLIFASYQPHTDNGGSNKDIVFPTDASGIFAYVNNQIDDRKEALKIAKSITQWSEKFDVDPKLITAIIYVESSFNPLAISNAGAMGLMQVLPRWHVEKIKEARSETGTPEVFNIDTNIYLGSRIISDCFKQYKNVTEKALLCYNGSVGTKTDYAKKVMSEYRRIKNFITNQEV